jgi:hypothetical protein
MTDQPSYKLSVGSAAEYEKLIAEIHFPGKAGVIVSEENKDGKFEISLHAFREKSGDEFDYCRNVAEAKIPLEEFREAIDKAVSELERLKKGSTAR